MLIGVDIIKFLRHRQGSKFSISSIFSGFAYPTHFFVYSVFFNTHIVYDLKAWRFESALRVVDDHAT